MRNEKGEMNKKTNRKDAYKCYTKDVQNGHVREEKEELEQNISYYKRYKSLSLSSGSG